jgi:hypothetical protein
MLFGDTSMTFPAEMLFKDGVQNPLCSHHFTEEGIHKFTFQDSSRAAVNEWIECLAGITTASSDQPILTIILDTRISGTLPLAYVTRKMRDVFATCAPQQAIRLAILSGQSALMVLIQMLAEIAAPNETSIVQYHQSQDEAEAITWLLAAE